MSFFTKTAQAIGEYLQSVNTPTYDPQISGVLDDGTNEGSIRAKLVTGELVKVPLSAIDYSTVISGSATVSDLFNIYTNGDGTGQIVNMSTVAGLGTNACALRTVIYGRVVGVRYRRNSSTPAFSVLIDGTPYGVPAYNTAPRFTNSSGPADREALFIIADDLTDTAHSVEIVLYPDASVAKTLIVYGFTAERRAGYLPADRIDVIYSQGTLTNASVAVPGSTSVRSIKYIWYQNTDLTNPHRVTVNFNSVSSWSKMIAAGDTEILRISEVGATLSGNSSTWSHLADANSVVKFTCIGNG